MKPRLSFFFALSTSLLILLAFKSQTKVVNPDPLRFKGEIDAFVEMDKKDSYPDHAILFEGSSSIRFWHSHESFPAYPIINRGFGGSHLSDVLYYYDQVIKKYDADIIVFYEGDNDIEAGKTAEQVFEDYKTLISKIKKDKPHVKFIYLPIKPSIARWSLWEEMDKANKMIKDYNAKDGQLYYADTATPLLGSDGKPQQDLFREDGLHLNDNGYKKWNDVLKPMFEELYSSAKK